MLNHSKPEARRKGEARNQKPEARRKGEARNQKPEARRKVKGKPRGENASRPFRCSFPGGRLCRLNRPPGTDFDFLLASGFRLPASPFLLASGFWLLACLLPGFWLVFYLASGLSYLPSAF
jgi:hypothetical protein